MRKRCTKCGVEKSLDDFYKSTRDGYRSRCKPCSRADALAWNKANRHSLNEAGRRWKQRNPDKVKAQKVAWRKANPEKVRRHKQIDYERHRGKIIQRVRDWVKENPEMRRAQCHRRRSLQAGAPGATYTTAEHLKARFDLYGGQCYYCRAAPAEAMDHRIALARGGSHWPANLVPACKSCNSRKNVKSELEFKQAA